MQYYTKVMAMTFTALIYKLDYVMWLYELQQQFNIMLCMCLGNHAENFVR